jgi:hypothetical protein
MTPPAGANTEMRLNEDDDDMKRTSEEESGGTGFLFPNESSGHAIAEHLPTARNRSGGACRNADGASPR